MWQETYQYFSQMAVLEIIAVITAMAYVILAAREHILCWPAALISTLLYTIIFYDVYLWMDSALQVYYFAMAIYGFYCWRRVGANGDALADNKEQTNSIIHQQPLIKHCKALLVLALTSIAVGYFMANNTPTTFPYVDAATTVFAVYATYLVTQKVLENWLYWIVIDLVSIYIYIEKGLTPTAMLFVVYVVVAVVGYFTWREKLKQSVNSENHNQQNHTPQSHSENGAIETSVRSDKSAFANQNPKKAQLRG